MVHGKGRVDIRRRLALQLNTVTISRRRDIGFTGSNDNIWRQEDKITVFHIWRITDIFGGFFGICLWPISLDKATEYMAGYVNMGSCFLFSFLVGISFIL